VNVDLTRGLREEIERSAQACYPKVERASRRMRQVETFLGQELANLRSLEREVSRARTATGAAGLSDRRRARAVTAVMGLVKAIEVARVGIAKLRRQRARARTELDRAILEGEGEPDRVRREYAKWRAFVELYEEVARREESVGEGSSA